MKPAEPEAPLAELARERRRSFEGWDAYAAGQSTLEEARAAARVAGQSEEEIERCAVLFAPFDEAGIANLTAAVHRADAMVVRPARWIRPAALAGVAAIAAASIFWFARAPESNGVAPAAASPMVAHELSITGVAEVRGSDDAATPSVPVGSTLGFSLRPATAHAVRPIVWACAVRSGIELPLTATVLDGKPGTTLEVSAPLPSAVTPGAWELVAFVSSVPAPASDACKIEASAQTKVTRARFDVR